MSLRGHEEKFGRSRNDNYVMLLEAISEFDTFLVSRIVKFGHPGSGKTSHLLSTIAEEFLFIIAKAVTEKLFLKLKKLGTFH